ncbi:MAG: triacylglycerol lipase [Pseudomonas sp.]|uniref:esterase/lipase family protein n=1 Tax=Pseudomonas sp. TaxID=306 RepID=UPI003398DB2A
MHKVLRTALGLLLIGLSLSTQAAYTTNPIVLVPGIFAFDKIAMIDYWYQIPATLQAQGNEVYVPKINAFDNSFERGQQLIRQLDSIKVASLGRIQKFNLIAHSQGGITSRYVMNVRPDLVASVTTMSTPHTGSPLADIVTGVAPPDSLQGVAFEAFANAVGNLVNIFSNNKASKSDINAMLGEFNKKGSAAFNGQFPAGLPTQRCGAGPDRVTIDGQVIRLYSWGGGSRVTNVFDPSDALFGLTGLAFGGEANDGVTGACANHFGQVIQDRYRMNHIDINNQVFGVVSWFESNPKTVFRNHATRLKQAGL